MTIDEQMALFRRVRQAAYGIVPPDEDDDVPECPTPGPDADPDA